MKRTLTLLLLALLASGAFSQSADSTSLFEFNRSRNKKTTRGLQVLGGWAAANIATSGIMYYNTKGTDQYFHQMNVMWNGVNAIIAVASLLPKDRNDLDMKKSLQWQSNTEATFITSAALDILYSSAGLYLTERAKTDPARHDKFKGWGNSLIMQGGFLFILDTAVYVVHKRNGKKLYNMMDRVRFGTSGLGFKVGIQL
ncbi:MAG TPA: hypothetical protein VF868_15595 [Bacteroidia bacterium]|jgi:hypothetical protein